MNTYLCRCDECDVDSLPLSSQDAADEAVRFHNETKHDGGDVAYVEADR